MKRAVKITAFAIAVTLVAAAVLVNPRTAGAAAEPGVTNVPETKAGGLKTVIAVSADSAVGLVDGVRKSLEPSDNMVMAVKENGELLAPASFLAAASGGTISWNAATRTVLIKAAGQEISYTIGKAEMTASGSTVKLQTAPMIVRNKTFVPVKSFASALGAEYFTDGENLAVIGGDGSISKDKDALNALRAKLQALPVVGTKEKFLELMAGHDEYIVNQRQVEISGAQWFTSMEPQMESGTMTGSVSADVAAAPAAPVASAPAPTPAPSVMNDGQKQRAASGEGDYSTTNVQVEGVDEADIIKTDGQYIYFVKENRISVVNAGDAENMVLESTVLFADEAFRPSDMYVDGNTLVVLGNGMRQFLVDGMQNYQSTTRAYVYDMSSHKNPKLVREFESDGSYLSSRKIGNSFYMITNSWLYNINGSAIYPVPMFRDTAVSQSYAEIGYDRMFYFPNFNSKNYLIITGFELDKPKQAAKVNTFLGSGQNVYASLDNLYVAATEYEYPAITPLQEPAASTMPTDDIAPRIAIAPIWRSSGEKTAFYKFALDAGNVLFESKQSVDGTLLNQFSMDEHNGHFRTVTTSYDYNTGVQKNALYVMDGGMKVTGKIEDIAPGERIYSARFMGDKGYMVTFKNVDPLFAIDLKDPKNPKILGALKIPGYSNYLHPYDENHLIGFGKDTTEYQGTAYYKGMKIAIFDVTDMTNPKELFVEYIGDRGTDSPLLYDHKALLFSKDKNLLAFPVNVATLTDEQKTSQNSIWEYGHFTFQGAYVYSIDLTDGFKLSGKVSHMSDQDLLKAGYYGGDYMKQIQRLIYIGDNLYTASQSMIKANSLNGLKELGSVNLE